MQYMQVGRERLCSTWWHTPPTGLAAHTRTRTHTHIHTDIHTHGHTCTWDTPQTCNCASTVWPNTRFRTGGAVEILAWGKV